MLTDSRIGRFWERRQHILYNGQGCSIPLFKRRITRREMLLTTGGAMTAILLAGCSGAQEKSAPPIAGSFVGPVEGTDSSSFVAVVAAGPEQEGAEEREVRAYLCSAEVEDGGQTINEWFTGTAAGNDLDLTSEDGAQLKGSLASEAATGTMTLNDGTSLPFTADLATGVAGLYNVNLLPEGQVNGTSETGGRLEGQLGELRDGFYPVTVTLTAPDGEKRNSMPLFDTDEPGEFRFIILPDGTAKGAKKGVPTGSGKGAGFVWPCLD